MELAAPKVEMPHLRDHRQLLAVIDGRERVVDGMKRFLASMGYIRGAARELTGDARGAHDEALRLLDNKGNFLHIVDTCVGALAPGTEPAKLCGEKWAKVKQHHRAKFEKLGGAEGVAAKKRPAREARAEYKLQQEARAEREATHRCSEAVACTKFVQKKDFVVDDDGEEPLPIFTRRKLQC